MYYSVLEVLDILEETEVPPAFLDFFSDKLALKDLPAVPLVLRDRSVAELLMVRL